ncbi:IPT/TIG domain-containing protein [Actinoplanes sp. NPDC049802]|uniref:IPT/TIG domain-containing protein n=1 Tax=Actinoplanes sp. NPDC049802 TaxID=3154742 RepID=UPI0033C7F1C2
MPLLTSRRGHRAAAIGAAAGLVVGASLVGAQSAEAATNYGVTITAVTPAKVAAGLGNRVVVITGTNFDEDQITGITLGADPDCAELTSYVVTSSTSISVKTPSANGASADGVPGCTAGAAADVTIHQTELGTATRAASITFVDPPALATTNPMITENSSSLTTGNQVKTFHTTGNQTIRIKAGSGTTFSGQAGAALSGTYGGKALTSVGFLDPTGATQLASAAGSPGNYWIAKTAASLTAASNTLTISLNGVSRTFSATDTGTSLVALPTITSLDVTSGKTNASTQVRITGTNFNTTIGDWTVTFCGVAGTVTAATATQLTVTTPVVGGVTPGLGTTAFAGVCPVSVVNANNGSPLTSPVSPASYFTFLNA